MFGTYNVKGLRYVRRKDSANRQDSVVCILRFSPLNDILKLIKIKALGI